MKFTLASLCTAVITGSLMTGCGGLELGKNVKVQVDAQTQKASMEFEMSDGLEVSMMGEFPIANGKGSITFVPATKTENGKILLSINLAAIIGDPLSGAVLMNTFPNGSPFPVAAPGPFFALRASNSTSNQVDALIALTPEVQLGALVTISQFSATNVPVGISVCQNFRNGQNVAFAAICLVGPSATSKGGIFVGASLGDVLNLDQLMGSSQAYSASRAFSASPSALQSLSLESTLTEQASSNWDPEIYDPNDKLQGSTAMRTIDNVRKVLRVRRK